MQIMKVLQAHKGMASIICEICGINIKFTRAFKKFHCIMVYVENPVAKYFDEITSFKYVETDINL